MNIVATKYDEVNELLQFEEYMPTLYRTLYTFDGLLLFTNLYQDP